VTFDGEPIGEDERGVLEPRSSEGTTGDQIVDIVLFEDGKSASCKFDLPHGRSTLRLRATSAADSSVI